MPNPFSINKLISSFGHAIRGIKTVFKTEQNFRIHTIATLLVLLLSRLLKISKQEFILIILCIASVMVTEILNTAIEKLCDFVSPQYHDKIKTIKDMSAGAVLLMSITALIIGLTIFIPKIFQFLEKI